MCRLPYATQIAQGILSTHSKSVDTPRRLAWPVRAFRGPYGKQRCVARSWLSWRAPRPPRLSCPPCEPHGARTTQQASWRSRLAWAHRQGAAPPGRCWRRIAQLRGKPRRACSPYCMWHASGPCTAFVSAFAWSQCGERQATRRERKWAPRRFIGASSARLQRSMSAEPGPAPWATATPRPFPMSGSGPMTSSQ